ncbi:MAG TPA: glucosyl-3-phosphoglycerate synthase [Acidimicrobiia bacterium]|jgi:glucosyl-3-phosphoglycerate synthase|nr:glucosyl-3-phosphoglycerate synthase [Acidimicrobiia bacterium]
MAVRPLDRERAAGSVSVCLPARDEAATIGPIVAAIRRDLVERDGLVDEIVVVDDGSTDETARIAEGEGARVVAEATILPELGEGSGKGNALWKSLYVCEGDIVCWLDADIRNFDSAFVSKLVRPLLDDANVLFTKAYYRRPLNGEPNGGGRVTELVARPIISQCFPALRDIVQPLSGEYAGRREVLELLPFVEGWGVELGLLADLAQRYGAGVITQVDLGVREHRNRPVDELGPQALAILVAALQRVGVGDVAPVATELVRFDDDHRPVRVPVEVRERPPMRTVPAYRARFRRELAV